MSVNALCFLQELFYISPSHLLIFKTFFYFVLIAHLLSCLLLGIGSLRRSHRSSNLMFICKLDIWICSIFKCNAVGSLCDDSDVGNGLTWMTEVSITTTQDTSVLASQVWSRTKALYQNSYFNLHCMLIMIYGWRCSPFDRLPAQHNTWWQSTMS